MKRFVSRCLALALLSGTVFTSQGPWAVAGEKPAQDSGGSEKPAGKKKKAAGGETGAEAGKKESGSGDAKPLTLRERSNLKKRMRALAQSGKLDLLRGAVKKVLDPKAEADLSLLRDGEFYQAGLCAHDGDEKGFWDWAEKAIGHGHINADGFENLGLIPDAIKNTEKFKSRMQKLRSEAETVVWQEFTDEVRAGIEKPASDSSVPFPAESGIGPHPLTAKDFENRAACLVVTPILHDGFEKELSHLREIAKRHADRVAVAVLLYQYDDNEAWKKRTGEYLTRLKIDFPAALVTRSYVKPLDIPFYPCHFFLNRNGKTVCRQDGYLPEKKMEFIFAELAKATPPIEKPKKEEPPAPKPEEPKPPEPTAPKSESAAPAPPAEKPPEKPADKPKEPESPPPSPEPKPAPAPAPEKPPPAKKDAPPPPPPPEDPKKN